VLIGIDQGEVISPLLWCIYYDPLLCQIQDNNEGYNMKHNFRENLYIPQTTTESITISSMAYMDDTTWIASSKQNMESILQTADDFNHLNNIKVNKQKSELLMHVPGQPYNDEVSIEFGQETIRIRPARRGESIRLLGIWVNLNKDRKFVINQAKDEISNLCHRIKKKKLTDKQMLYLYNMVIVPLIEYRTQLTYLSKNECHTLVAPFRKLFKQKLRLAISIPNAILENQLIYKYRNLYEIQRQSKITNFVI
jgi:hypothetical protein